MIGLKREGRQSYVGKEGEMDLGDRYDKMRYVMFPKNKTQINKKNTIKRSINRKRFEHRKSRKLCAFPGPALSFCSLLRAHIS